MLLVTSLQLKTTCEPYSLFCNVSCNKLVTQCMVNASCNSHVVYCCSTLNYTMYRTTTVYNCTAVVQNFPLCTVQQPYVQENKRFSKFAKYILQNPPLLEMIQNFQADDTGTLSIN